ncbi:glutamine synthetase family protein [Kordiimonas lacus]|uniref:Glutamine synthetase n=1 Tax=Kordiimonas lacus TaxID=637679 RepID=A0A1G7EUP1_9PROT|nr:glutamine synthetase [Kordiimonas lacus]SDE67331.1 glutamine synthetase [Kordiimonas lacus]
MVSLAEVKTMISANRDRHVKVGLFDIDGILRGKYLSADKFLSALEGGFGFCDVVMGWDMDDQLYDNVSFTGWHTGYPDAQARIVPESYRTLAAEGGTPFFLAEFTGKAAEICPRNLLQRVLDRAKNMGYTVKAGIEYEFFVFDETPESAREKGFRNLTPLSPGAFGYSALRSCEHAEFYQALLKGAADMGIQIEGLHEETGAGVLEAAITVNDGLAAADNAALFKLMAKVVARAHGKMVSFMAKTCQEWPGQSGHMHLSLWKDDQSAFFKEEAEHRMSPVMRQFVAGQRDGMPEMLAMIAPTINAYRRMVPGFWAPTTSTWGVENRTCALRVIPGSKKSQRVEYRISAADANPYLALAAAIASGLWGVENERDPGQPMTGNAYDVPVGDEHKLPLTLWDAAQRLRASTAARDWFGDAFVDHFAATREWEEREFRKHVTDWELNRYFEII